MGESPTELREMQAGMEAHNAIFARRMFVHLEDLGMSCSTCKHEHTSTNSYECGKQVNQPPHSDSYYDHAFLCNRWEQGS